jgi:hypothetical protein
VLLDALHQDTNGALQSDRAVARISPRPWPALLPHAILFLVTRSGWTWRTRFWWM